MIHTDCTHSFLTAGGTRHRCMVGRIPDLDCESCPVYQPLVSEPKDFPEGFEEQMLEMAERAR